MCVCVCVYVRVCVRACVCSVFCVRVRVCVRARQVLARHDVARVRVICFAWHRSISLSPAPLPPSLSPSLSPFLPLSPMVCVCTRERVFVCARLVCARRLLCLARMCIRKEPCERAL